MNEIIHGDSYLQVKELEENSIDLLCTDPPYGISFMGKAWDKAVPPVSFWQDCLKALKPGAFAFVMLTEGSYDLNISATAGAYLDSTITGVAVTALDVTNIGTVTLEAE